MPRDGRTLPHNILEEMRFRAIEAHQAGKGVAEIAKLLGVHWGSVSRWLTKWRRDGQRASLKLDVWGGFKLLWEVEQDQIQDSWRVCVGSRGSVVCISVHRSADRLVCKLGRF